MGGEETVSLNVCREILGNQLRILAARLREVNTCTAMGSTRCDGGEKESLPRQYPCPNVRSNDH